MKNINVVANNLIQNNFEAIIPAEISQHEIQIINDVVQVLMAIKPAWKAAFPTESAMDGYKRELCHLIIKHKIGIEKLEKALDAARECPNPFMPSTGQFLLWCNHKKSTPPSHKFFKPEQTISQTTEEERQEMGMSVVGDMRALLRKNKK